MAVLGATSLTGCNSIPSFIGAGSKMVFNMATSPVSWTKDTTINEGMLRITNAATLSPGGTTPFSQIFSSTTPISVQLNQNAVNFTISQISAFPSAVTSSQTPSPSTSGGTVATSQFSSHAHQFTVGATGQRGIGTLGYCAQTLIFADSGPSGQNGAHAHSIQAHGHQWSTAAPRPLHGHSISGQHSHTVSGTQDFNVSYVDMIISTKN